MTKTNTWKFSQHVDTPLNVADLSTAANLATIGNVINVARNTLLQSFNTENFIVDQTFVTNVEKVAWNIAIREADFRNQIQLLNDEDTRLFASLTALTAKGPPPIPPLTTGRSPAEDGEFARIPFRRLEIGDLVSRLTTLLNPANRPTRQIEYQNMATRVKKFNLTDTIPDMTKNASTIEPDLMIPGKRADRYGFFDNEGRTLTWPITVDITLTDGTVQKVIMTWLRYIAPPAPPHAPGTVDVSLISFRDSRTNIAVVPTQWYEFSIHVWARINLPWAPIIPLVNMKSLKIIRPKPGTLNEPQQRARYGLFINAAWIPINQYIQDFYDNNYKEVEDKLLDEMIGDTISDAGNKKVLRNRIKEIMIGGNRLSPFVIGVNQDQLNDWFREHFFANVKPSADDISTPTKYNDFLRKNIPEQLKTYTEKELKRQMESTTNTPVGWLPLCLPATRTLHDIITNEILTYRQEQEDRAQDNFVDSNDLSTHTVSNEKRRSPKLSKAWIFDILGKKDASYMRFLSNQSQEISKQTVSLQTDRDKNKVEFAGYEAKVHTGNIDNIAVDIKLDNGEELSLKGGNHIALMKSILNEPRIPYGKMRMHIAYNVIKAMIKIANKNNITLEYADGNIINSLSIDKNEDIILERVDDTTGIRSKDKLFSEKDFDAENDMHQLRRGLEDCLWRFNNSMERIHKQYKEATDKKLFWYLSLSRAKFPTSRIGSPIKKLMNMRKSRTLNFDFADTKVEWISKNISVSFSKNTFTITSDLLEKPISSKNLGKLLRTRVKGNRIFDGMERAIWGTIYKNMISKLRENSKIANTNFGVKDPVKNRVYFLDKSWEIGYIALANNKNPIDSITKWFKNDYGVISKMPSVGRIMLTKTEEQNELYQNPLIMWKLMKTMNTRLYSF